MYVTTLKHLGKTSNTGGKEYASTRIHYSMCTPKQSNILIVSTTTPKH